MNTEKENIKKELKNIGSKLLLTEKDGLDIPAGYFDELEKDILNNTIFAEEKRGDIKKGSKKKNTAIVWLKYVSGIAAAVIIILGIRNYTNKGSESLAIQLSKMSDAEIDIFIEDQIASISIDDLNKYLSQNVDEFDTELLFETDFISDASLQKKITKEVNDQILPESTTENKASLLDEKLLNELDEQTLQDFINDETLYDDIGF
ncbi:MAG: hypothetical protein ACHQFW_03030 [Chitinophagales bacterium]